MVLGLQMLGLLALAAAPDLHRALHADSDCQDHHCLVTMFVQGQVTGVEVEAVLTFFAVFFLCTLRRPKTPPQSLFQYRYSPSRAPPQV